MSSSTSMKISPTKLSPAGILHCTRRAAAAAAGLAPQRCLSLFFLKAIHKRRRQFWGRGVQIADMRGAVVKRNSDISNSKSADLNIKGGRGQKWPKNCRRLLLSAPFLLTYSIPHLLSQFFWPDLLLHMATKQDRDSSSLKTDASPEKTAPVSIIILQPPYYKT